MIDRVRKVDLNSMSEEQVESLSEQIGIKVRNMCDESADKINALLGIYGLSAKLTIKFDEIPENMKNIEEKPQKVKKPRKAKQANLNKIQTT